MAAAPAVPLRGRGRSRRSPGGAAMACAGYGTSATWYGLSHHHIRLSFYRLIINIKHYRLIINVTQIVARVLLFTIFIIFILRIRNSSSGHWSVAEHQANYFYPHIQTISSKKYNLQVQINILDDYISKLLGSRDHQFKPKVALVYFLVFLARNRYARQIFSRRETDAYYFRDQNSNTS